MEAQFLAWVLILAVSVFAAAYFFVDMAMKRRGGEGVRAAESEFLSTVSPLMAVFKPLGTSFLRTMSSKDIKDLEQRLSNAGLRNDLRIDDFIALRFLSVVAGMFGGLLFSVATVGVDVMALGICALFGFFGWMYPNVWVNSVARSRQQRIFRGLSNTLDVLSISVQAGLEVREALERVVRIGAEPELDREIDKTLQEINKGGKSLQQGFEDLRDRINMPEMTAFCNVMLMAFQLGAVGVGDLLAEQAEAIRNERVLRAERMASEMPAKILFPIAVFIFPAVLVTILGPMVLRAYLEFGDK